MGRILSDRTGIELDRAGPVRVIGDLARGTRSIAGESPLNLDIDRPTNSIESLKPPAVKV